MSRYPDELRADLQETYGLCLDDLGNGLSVHHAAVLAVQLPQTSRVVQKLNPSNGWTDTEYLLARAVNVLLWGQWVMCGQKSSRKPRYIEPPQIPAAAGVAGKKQDSTANNKKVAPDMVPVEVNDYLETLKRIRKEARGG